MRTITKIIIILLIIFIAIFGFFILSEGNSELIGENNLGYVSKITYSYTDNPTVKIGIVSGMHSRELNHKFVLPLVCRFYSLFHPDVEIVNYYVKVTDSPEDFTVGRANGESLVHDYVVDDVAKSDLDLVIIGHDHEPTYGEGYYIATPTMDKPSVKLASKVSKDIGFNYYKRNKNSVAKSTSIVNVDNPIVATGTRVFVYEIPEVDNKISAFRQSYRLVEASCNRLLNQ